MLQFIPVTDDYLEHDPALYLRLVPFSLDYPCRRLAVEPLVGSTLESAAMLTSIGQLSIYEGESHE